MTTSLHNLHEGVIDASVVDRVEDHQDGKIKEMDADADVSDR